MSLMLFFSGCLTLYEFLPGSFFFFLAAGPSMSLFGVFVLCLEHPLGIGTNTLLFHLLADLALAPFKTDLCFVGKRSIVGWSEI